MHGCLLTPYDIYALSQGTGGGPTIPASLRQLLYPGDQPAYYTEEEFPNHSHLLKDYSSGVGSLREKRLGYCYDFDGVNDYVTPGSRVTTGSVTALTVCGWVKFTGVDSYTFVNEYDGTVNQRGWNLFHSSANPGKLSYLFSSDGTSAFTRKYGSTTINDGVWHHVAVVQEGADFDLYVDGLLETMTTISTAAGSSVFNTTAPLRIGFDNGTTYSNASKYDFRVYEGVAADDAAANIAGIVAGTYAGSPSVHYPLQEESGTTAYDISGNDNHGTITNAVTSGVGSIHQPDAGVTKSYPNDEGYRLSGGVYIPAKSATLAADDNALTETGRVPQYGTALSYGWQGDGSTVYVDLGELAIPATADFDLELSYFHVTNDTTRRVIIGTETNSDMRLQVNGSGVTGIAGTLSLQIGGVDGFVTSPDLIEGWNNIQINRIGSSFTLVLNEIATVGTYAGSLYPVGGSVANRLLMTLTALYNDGIVGPITITTGVVTTTFHPIPGTRDVAKVVSNAEGSVISDAVVNGVLADLYTIGNGSWSLPHIENGARWANQNLLINSEALNLWARIGGATVTANATTAPDGTLTADRISVPSAVSEDHVRFQYTSLPAGTYTFSFYAKSISGASNWGIKVNAGTNIQAIIALNDTEWTRCTLTFTTASSTSPYFYPGDARVVEGQAYVWGVQLNEGSVPLPYERTGATNQSASALVPAGPGQANAVNGNPINIPANKHPRSLIVDRTGGVIAPLDYSMGTDGYTNEEFNDIPADVTVNKRGVSIYAADRYGAALTDIQS